MRVFLSYTAADWHIASTLVDMARRILFEHDCETVHVYAYEWSNISGDLWQERLHEELTNCDCTIVLWTRSSLESIAQHIEIGAAWILRKDMHIVLYGTSSSSLPSLALGGRQVITLRNFYQEFSRYVHLQMELSG